VDALDSQTLSVAARDGKAALADERAADGPAAEEVQDEATTADLRADQTGVSAEAPHSGEDGSLGRDDTGIHGSGPGVALGEFGIGRVCAAVSRDILRFCVRVVVLGG
jgi:hypothetical protein